MAVSSIQPEMEVVQIIHFSYETLTARALTAENTKLHFKEMGPYDSQCKIIFLQCFFFFLVTWHKSAILYILFCITNLLDVAVIGYLLSQLLWCMNFCEMVSR